MIALHGIWSHSEGDKTAGTFVIWGETSPTTETRRRPSASGEVASPRSHPFMADAEELRKAMASLGPGESVQVDFAFAKSIKVALLLPTLGGRPQRSPALGPSHQGESREPDVQLRSHIVRGFGLPPTAVLELLALLPWDPSADLREVVVGDDLKYWSVAARFALELLARQRLFPTLQQSQTGQTLTRWEPLLSEAGDLRRFNVLADSMPAACRSLAGATIGPRALLADFLATVVDSRVRDWLQTSPTGRYSYDQSAAFTSSGEKWLRALRTETPVITGTDFQLGSLRNAVQEWSAPLRSSGDEAGFRTCFRLEAPEENDEDVGRARATDRQWLLSILLQASDDPSLVVPAEAVWRERGRTLSYLNRRFEQPQERLLADLGRAALIFPPLEESLKSSRPENCYLTTSEAYHFLREATLLFEECGFGVLVPPWWERRKKQLGVRLKLKASAQVSKGLMGKDAIVNYNWELALGDDELSRAEFERLAAMKVPLVRLRGEWVELDGDQIERAIRFYESRRAKDAIPATEALRLLLGGAGGQDGLPVTDIEADGWLADLVDHLKRGERLVELQVPEEFCGQLRPYQVRGYSWLAFLRQWGLGACLADDMGLGKTIQFIALLLRDLRGKGSQPALLVCPTSVVGNWRREVARFAPSARVMVHHGADRLEGEAFAEQAGEHDLVITTYPLVHRDGDSLCSLDWNGVILDEAQNIKNPATKQAQSVRKLKAGYRIALTGTPVENRLSELWSIMEFLNPGYLGSAEGFRKQFALPIERWQNLDRAAELRQLVQPFVLRRMKSDPTVIQDLPDKMEMKVYCTLTREQATLYEAVVRDMMEKIEEAEDIQRKGLVLAALTKLKQVCNHPAHFLADRSNLQGRSGKLSRLEEMLEEVLSEGDRALIFTQFAEFGGTLREYLQETLGREVLFLHGGVPQKARDQMVTRFQEDPHGPPLFVLSLKAGGVGLNLMRANHVFHFDRWWNPAVENQATDRAFRIGQSRNVQVHKFICAGTLEDRIDELIESKKALAENVVGTGEGWLTELSTDQLRDVFALRTDAVSDE